MITTTPTSHCRGRAPSLYEVMETTVRELLIERHLIGAHEIRRQIEVLDSRTPALGGAIIARAWIAELEGPVLLRALDCPFATILFQKGILTPEELAVKMQQVKARWACDDGALTG